ncbi:MAG: hypothetical protein C4538_04765 [Nitrospiraceae bacterium]|nr:MAG: hypothetical protein C4538_04765 [Nitrospiraceae bacterium]
MNATAYKKYKLEQITRSENEDSLLIFADAMVHLKDARRINLFWDEDEEELIRIFMEEIKKSSVN